MLSSTYAVKVRESRLETRKKPSAGPVYRCIYAKDGLLELPDGMHSPWEFFSNRGVKTGDRCGIYGSNCPEWSIAMEACNSQAVTYAPLYDSLGANAVEFVVNHAEVSIAFVQENKLPDILSCLPACCSYLKTIVSFGNVSSTQKNEAEGLGVSLFSWKEFSELCSEEDTYFSFLPLAHVFDQTMETYFIKRGSSIGFWQGDVRYLMDDVQELKPTAFCAVPRVYDRIYTGIVNQIASGCLVRNKLFEYAYNYKLRNMENGFPQDKASPLMDKLVFEKVKQALGGKVRLMLSGAAPLPRRVEEFLRVSFCSSLTQGHGLTETCGGCFTSVPNVMSMIGTVAVPITTIEARLESVPEMGYDALSDVPCGEICLRGNTLFSGYYKRQDLTDEVVIDGWKKNIFKLSQEEYVAVGNIENTYSRCPHIASIWVYGNSFESFLVAVVVPERKALQDWAVEHNEPIDFKSLWENPKARKYILNELTSTGQKHKLRGFEMLKAVHLEPNPFDMERDLVTPTFKLKRPQMLKYFKDKIDQLYNEAKGPKV
ncbi:hypothetical protein V6N13_090234 [Hibiscus sabdariffa]